jgi:magnesium-transporting ATPase (P-type)
LHNEQNIAELPFDSRRKRMTVVHTQRVDGAIERVAYVKGGIREILDVCTSIRVGDQIVPLNQDWISFIMAQNDDFARQGLRVLAAAARTLPRELDDYQVETIEADLTFLGMVAMMDPPRVDVTEAVEKCHKAGIRIIMITGDYASLPKASPAGLAS